MLSYFNSPHAVNTELRFILSSPVSKRQANRTVNQGARCVGLHIARHVDPEPKLEVFMRSERADRQTRVHFQQSRLGNPLRIKLPVEVRIRPNRRQVIGQIRRAASPG